jgi:hypothetical protein
MSNENPRAASILDALLNKPATTQQKLRVQAAFGDAGTYLAELYAFTLQRVREFEGQAALIAARKQTDDAVAADFTQTP